MSTTPNTPNALEIAAQMIEADGADALVVDLRRLESADDAFRAIRGTAEVCEAIIERAQDRAITANRTIGRTLIWIYDAVCDYAGIPVNKRTKREDLTIGKVSKVIGVNRENASTLTGCAFDSLGAAIELGRADDHYHREARLALDDAGESVNVKSLRRALNAAIHPEVVSNRAAGAVKARTAAIAAVTGGSVKSVANKSGADAKVVTAVVNKVAASLLTPAAIAAASDEQIAATIWALSQVRDARKAGTVKRTVKRTPKGKASAE